MGNAYVTYIYDDGLRVQRDLEKLPLALGTALLKVCLNPSYAPTAKGTERITSEAVLQHGNCVNYVDEVRATDDQLYLWSGNCLRAIGGLNVDQLTFAQQLLDKELALRKAKK